MKNAGLAGQDDPEFYILRTSHPDNWDRHHFFLLETAFPASVMAPWIRTQIAQLDPTVPVEIDTLSQDVNKLADRPRFETALLGFFAACGLLMAVIGLYGVISYVATQRTQEIGVRMALGATRADILRLIAMEGMRLILLGGVLGLGAALATAQLLKSLDVQRRTARSRYLCRSRAASSPGCSGSDSDSGARRNADRPGRGPSLRIVADALKKTSRLVTTETAILSKNRNPPSRRIGIRLCR